jgi:hypothetical protein
VTGFYRGMLIVGVLLIVLSGVIVLGDSDNLSARMPTQVVPRRYARYPFGAGIALALVALVGVVFT